MKPGDEGTTTLKSESEAVAVESRAVESGSRAAGPPLVGSIGYTGSYREFPEDLVGVSVVSVLEARGPD